MPIKKPRTNKNPRFITSLTSVYSTRSSSEKAKSSILLRLVHSIISKCAMRYFDLRFCIIVLINMAKSQIGGISWDLITRTNFFCFLLILAAFSSVSIEIPLTLSTCSFRTLHIRLRFGNRPLSTAVSFMASLILPQPLFWYVYPAILLLSFYPTARDHALRSLQVVLPINKVYNIFISTAAVEVMNEPHPQQAESSSETQDLEANIEAE